MTPSLLGTVVKLRVPRFNAFYDRVLFGLQFLSKLNRRPRAMLQHVAQSLP